MGDQQEPPPPPAKTSRVESGYSGGWEGLSPEILALIFVRIPADELSRVVPFVCKSWSEVVAGPYCWMDIDIEQWCRKCNRVGCITFAVRKLVQRSEGTCRRLSAFKLSNAAFSDVATGVKYIKVLQMPMSDVNDKMVKKHVESLKLLTYLDISYCLNITCEGLQALGQHCTSLFHLRRNMPPPAWQKDTGAVASDTDDGEALAIADTMHGLHHLELGYGCFTDIGLDAIFTKCKNLTHLDIIGCFGVKMESDDFEDKCQRLEGFRAPWDDEFEDENESESSDAYKDYSSDSDDD